MVKKTEKEITINELAGMVANGFSDLTEGMNSRLDKVETRLGALEDGQEQIKLRLDNVAYRFELVELQRRVVLLEKHAGITHD